MKKDFGWSYRVIKETCHHPDIGEYRTYGIQATTLETVHDVSTDRAFVERMAKLFTEHQLSPIHLYDTVEDMLL